MPLAGAASVVAAPRGLALPTLGGIVVALQWLAMSRGAISVRVGPGAEEAPERGEWRGVWLWRHLRAHALNAPGKWPEQPLGAPRQSL